MIIMPMDMAIDYWYGSTFMGSVWMGGGEIMVWRVVAMVMMVGRVGIIGVAGFVCVLRIIDVRSINR